MTLSILLPWFPIVLAVGVGARLLNRTRGAAFGLVAALFWVLFVQSTGEAMRWGDPLTIPLLLVGSLAIVLIGAWSGSQVAGRDDNSKTRPAPTASERSHAVDEDAFRSVHETATEFQDWLVAYRDEPDPWPKFDEFVRSALFRCCKARHVRTYRVPVEGDELVPLHAAFDPRTGRPRQALDPTTSRLRQSITDSGPESGPGVSARSNARRAHAREGIVGHTVTTGRSYVAGDASQGELVRKLAEQTKDAPAWCFVVRSGARRAGVVVCGELEIDPIEHRTLLRVVESFTAQCWNLLAEAHKSRTAELYDPVSQLLTREAFLTIGSESLAESYGQGEPVAVAVVTLERLRELNDSGQWALADRLIHEVSLRMREKLRADDHVGRFDGSRFLLLLRRVDSQLASLIIEQLSTRLNEVCDDESRWGVSVCVRCGLAGSGTDRPDLSNLVSRAVAQCHRARDLDALVASDLPGAVRRVETKTAGTSTG